MLDEGIKVRFLFEAKIAFIAYSLQYHTRKYYVYLAMLGSAGYSRITRTLGPPMTMTTTAPTVSELAADDEPGGASMSFPQYLVKKGPD